MRRKKGSSPRSGTSGRDNDESEIEGRCLKTADKLRQASDPVQEEALKLRKEMRQQGRSCLEIVGSGNERQILNSVGEGNCDVLQGGGC